jgi:hypothetical protein
MARPALLDTQPRMDGGLNSVSDEAALAPNQMRRAENARLTDFGAVTKRGGTRRVSVSFDVLASIIFSYVPGNSLAAATFARGSDATFTADV